MNLPFGRETGGSIPVRAFLLLLFLPLSLPVLADTTFLPKENSHILVLRPYDYLAGQLQSPRWNDIIVEHQYNPTQSFYTTSQVSFVFDSQYFGMSFRGGAGVHPLFFLNDIGYWVLAAFSLSAFGGYHWGIDAEGSGQNFSAGCLFSWRSSIARTIYTEFGLGEEYYFYGNVPLPFLKLAIGYEF